MFIINIHKTLINDLRIIFYTVWHIIQKLRRNINKEHPPAIYRLLSL